MRASSLGHHGHAAMHSDDRRNGGREGRDGAVPARSRRAVCAPGGAQEVGSVGTSALRVADSSGRPMWETWRVEDPGPAVSRALGELGRREGKGVERDRARTREIARPAIRPRRRLRGRRHRDSGLAGTEHAGAWPGAASRAAGDRLRGPLPRPAEVRRAEGGEFVGQIGAYGPMVTATRLRLAGRAQAEPQEREEHPGLRPRRSLARPDNH